LTHGLPSELIAHLVSLDKYIGMNR